MTAEAKEGRARAGGPSILKSTSIGSSIWGSLAGASLGCLAAAALDAYFAVQRQPAAWGATYLVSLGLMSPLVLPVAAFGALVRVLLLSPLAVPGALADPGAFADPGGLARPSAVRVSSFGGVLARVNPAEPGARRQLAVVASLGPLLALLGTLITSRWALSALSSAESASAAGARLALSCSLLLGAGWLLVESLAKALAGLDWKAPSPVACGAFSLLGATILFTLGVVSGPPSGAGNALFMLGVLSRDELDLRPLALLTLFFASSVLLPALRGRSGLLASLLGCSACLVWLPYAAKSGFEARSVALAVETAAPVASKLLPSWRRFADRDRDAYAAWFGGGDCDDSAPHRNPLAEDIPGNGADEDCSGADARLDPALTARSSAPSAEPSRETPSLKLPDDMNVLLLTVDTLRYDLGYAGNPRAISPRIDELARDSVVYERAYALASYTAKSLPPMLIGKYASETHRGYSHFNRFEKSDRFVAERVQKAGVSTASVQGHWYFFQNFGMERGFDVVDTSAAPRALQSAEGDRSITSEAISNAAMAQLAKLGSRRFFMWAHYTDPHAEYLAHAGFDFGNKPRGLYESEVAFVDHHVGRLLDALRQSPAWGRTVVILTSDHGEAFGEHGMIRHGFELWEELVRVPLILRIPSVTPKRIAARRSTIDLVPTILELLGLKLPSPEEDPKNFVSGSSLLADISGQAAPRPVFVDMAEGPHNAERRAFIDGDMKLVTSRGRVLSLFDLARDPEEKRDLAGDRDTLRPIQERYAAFRRTLREVVVRPPN